MTAKDLILFVIGRWGSDIARGCAVEFAGPVARALPVEGRLTVCDMVTELGGRTGLIALDDSVAAPLQGRACAPDGTDWHGAVADWQALHSDADAVFDTELRVDCSGLEPQITRGIGGPGGGGAARRRQRARGCRARQHFGEARV